MSGIFATFNRDGRLDNREELAAQLGLKDRPPNQIAEREFILKAYQKWGEEVKAGVRS